MTPIASFPMYDPAPLHAANDRLWALIRDRLRATGIAAPDALTRRGDHRAPWRDPGLVLSHTCGLPYRAGLHAEVTLIGTPDYGVEGCAPGYYRSVLVTRADDPRAMLAGFDGAVAAYNDALSQSGWGALWAAATSAGVSFHLGAATGGHRASAHAVALGDADIAALDAVTWRNLARWEPDLTLRLRVIGVTAPTPGLPLIAAAGADAGATRAAVSAAIGALDPADRANLGLRGLALVPHDAYLAVPRPPDPAQFGAKR